LAPEDFYFLKRWLLIILLVDDTLPYPVVLAFFFLINAVFIRIEEKTLQEKFGQSSFLIIITDW
jgi:hypothetical protein